MGGGRKWTLGRLRAFALRAQEVLNAVPGAGSIRYLFTPAAPASPEREITAAEFFAADAPSGAYRYELVTDAGAVAGGTSPVNHERPAIAPVRFAVES